jgi:hypothetical protein
VSASAVLADSIRIPCGALVHTIRLSDDWRLIIIALIVLLVFIVVVIIGIPWRKSKTARASDSIQGQLSAGLGLR